MKEGILIFLFINSMAIAEYRVYEFALKDHSNIDDQPTSQIIRSTLPPRTYLTYYSAHGNLKVDLMRTWICPGYTGRFKNLCNSPYDKFLKEESK